MMKTSEMFFALEENPKLMFESECTDLYIRRRVWVSDNGYFKYAVITADGTTKEYNLPGGCQFFGNIMACTNWQLVREPVPWQEALRAYINGKIIEVHCEKCVPSQQADKCRLLGVEHICPHGLRNGKWYIND